MAATCDSPTTNENELDAVVWEMCLAIKKCDINTKDGKNNLVEDWMDVENSAVTHHELLSDEVNAMMDLDIICKLKQAAIDSDVEWTSLQVNVMA